MRSIVGRLRERSLRVIDRSERARRALVGGAVWVAGRLGGDERVLTDVKQVDRPVNRSLQVVQWNLAIRGRVPFPRRFAPGDHLLSPTIRAVAVDLLRTADASPDDLERQLIGLDDTTGIDGTLAAVEHDLRTLIAGAARRPKRGSGIDSDVQLSIVRDIRTALDPAGLRPFLMSGTLLGFVRDGAFMPHDYDIDLGLLPGADLETAVERIEQLGCFEVEVVTGRAVAVHTSGVTVDLFTHELRDGLFWHATKVHEWWNTAFDLVEDELEGVPVWIPEDPRRYLDENYGDWSHPVPFYDISFDTPNRRYPEGLDAVRFLHSRCVQGLERGDRWTFESAARELRDRFGVDVTDLLAPSPLVER